VKPAYNALSTALADPCQSDKDWTVLIAGDSGSGKTVLAYNAPIYHGFEVLYMVLSSETLKQKPDLKTSRLNSCNALCRAVIDNAKQIGMAGRIDDVFADLALPTP